MKETQNQKLLSGNDGRLAIMICLVAASIHRRWLFSVFLAIAGIGQVSAIEWMRLEGRHINLTTDLDSKSEAERIIVSFDSAVEQWRQFFNLAPQSLSQWSVNALVMRDKSAFASSGLIPRETPEFKEAFTIGNTLLVTVQPSEYYTRHLVLHEGVHALSLQAFGGLGPSWYAEGTSELLATHEGVGAELIVNRVPRDRNLVPHWGRLRLIADRRNQNQIPTIESVMRYPEDLKADAESYAWCWAAAMLLTEHDDTRVAFLAAANMTRDSSIQFTRQFYQRLAAQWPVVVARWRLMCQTIDYGYDWQRERVDIAMNEPAWTGNEVSLDIDSQRGWQSSGVRVRAGSKLRISASGKLQIAAKESAWLSEPTGVTIQYANGRPIGQLLVCFVPLRHPNQSTCQPLQILAVNQELLTTAQQDCWVVFQVNDSVAERADNEGGFRVKMSLSATPTY